MDTMDKLKKGLDSYHSSLRKYIRKMENSLASIKGSMGSNTKLHRKHILSKISSFKNNLTNNIKKQVNKTKEDIFNSIQPLKKYLRDYISEQSDDLVVSVASNLVGGVVGVLCMSFAPSLTPEIYKWTQSIAYVALENLLFIKNKSTVSDKVKDTSKSVFDSVWNGFSLTIMNRHYNFGIKALVQNLTGMWIPSAKDTSDRINNIIDVEKYIRK